MPLIYEIAMNTKPFINGEEHETKVEFFTQSPFPEYSNLRWKVYGITKLVAEKMVAGARSAQKILANERKRLILLLADKFSPSKDCLTALCCINGMPISWVNRRIEEGKGIARNIALNLHGDSKKVVSIAIAPNDPREHFYFIATFIMAGCPSMIKLSSRDPFLGGEIARFLTRNGLPLGHINTYNFNTSEKDQSQLGKWIMEQGDISIVMGNQQITQNQITFNAECSRALVFDADQLSDKDLASSLLQPKNCMASHVFAIVGERNRTLFIEKVSRVFQSLRKGDLLDPNTTIGMIEPRIINEMTHLLEMQTEIFHGGHLVFPSSIEEIRIGESSQRPVLYEANTVDSLLLCTPLPSYVTAFITTSTQESAFRLIEASSHLLSQVSQHGKSMALTVYTQNPKRIDINRLTKIAYHVDFNQSHLSQVNGIDHHQGIDLFKHLIS